METLGRAHSPQPARPSSPRGSNYFGTRKEALSSLVGKLRQRGCTSRFQVLCRDVSIGCAPLLEGKGTEKHSVPLFLGVSPLAGH